MVEDNQLKTLQEAARVLKELSSKMNFEDLPRKEDVIFGGNNYYCGLNAVISQYGRGESIIQGYLHSAKTLSVITILSGESVDSFVYPICFLYRHYIELRVKSIIWIAIDKFSVFEAMNKNDILKYVHRSHDIKKLWGFLSPALSEMYGGRDDFQNVFNGLNSYFEQINFLDPISDSFRYSYRRKKGEKEVFEKTLEGKEYINILSLYEAMEKISSLLEGIHSEFSNISSE